MPKMGESVTEGTVIKWYKKVGDKVKRDETLFEISTDKVDTEVPSPVVGVLAEILVKENETADVDTVVAKIYTSDKIYKTSAAEKEETEAKLTNDEAAKQVEKVIPRKKKVNQNTNRFYSPLVMNIAQKENVSFNKLETIPGSGINGRVTKKDILNYIENRNTGKTFTSQEAKETVIKRGESVEVIPMNNIRKKIMQHMIQSRDTSVHVSEVMEVDMTKIHNFIVKNREKLLSDEGIKLTYMAFISYAAVKALKDYPFVNASIDGDNILVKKYVNLGIAVAVEPNGLIVPNIKNAEDKSVRGLAKAIADIGYRARNKKLNPDEVADGTFSITNYGVFGALFGSPIINQPEVAILGVGAVVKKPVVVEVDGTDVIAIKPMMYLSLSHDHRLVDGMLGGMFLKAVKNYLENFDVGSV
ncbi:dihydrolipoyllysine-residue succinyltransferase component of 2-oxoglutarate dehydrogenase complex [bacterium BMS3Abin04]|nr:dihydrolipoyllysine-residue succinyltransferase component of 2-oxoglutarate dehydrogenase complex [bacterium BMS3Abin04]